MEEKNFGDKIKLLRNKNKMTQEDLAKELNVTRQAISNWERGITIPDINMINNISRIFSITIDEIITGETKKIQKKFERKSSFILYISSIILFILNIVISTVIYKEIKIVTIFPVSIILFIETIIFFTFGNAIKNDNFSVIAGYDRKIQYNKIVLKKILASIENHIMITSTIFIFLMIILGHISTPDFIGGIILLIYVMEFLSSIIIINMKNQEFLYKDTEDLIQAKMSNKIVIGFIIFFFMILGVTTFTMEYYNIENNTPEAMIMISIIIPYIIFLLIGLLYEQKKVKEYIKKNKNYSISKLAYITMSICIVLLIIMVAVASKF
ncbi:MAG: helix-turn-helix domain-containing protein [Senegalia sp. (in: firmicutes)]|uniref:helix-turn-helix domain-containing protein n=1 Tax=Senegalia sp. (in: firmicutes) TaxID=1924098 RepID=UPI003F9B2EDB